MIGRFVPLLSLWTVDEADQIGPIVPGSNPPYRLCSKFFETGVEFYRLLGYFP